MQNDSSNKGQTSGHNKSFTIIVNGRPRTWTEQKISYREVVNLAFPDDPPNPDTIYTVSYANPHGHDGTLVEGQDTPVKDEETFNVTKTSRS